MAQPVVSVKQFPGGTATITGPFTWEMSVSNFDPNLHQVQYRVDAQLGGTHLTPIWVESYAPFFCMGDGNKYDPTGLSNGTHAFGVIVRERSTGKSLSNIRLWRNVEIAVAPPPPPPPPPPTGTIVYADPGKLLSVIDGCKGGEIVIARKGTHGKLVLDKDFPDSAPVTIRAEDIAATLIQGVDTNGRSNYVFDTVRSELPVEYSDLSKRAVENHGPSRNIRWIRSIIKGGFISWDVYGGSGQWAKNISLIDSDVSLGGGDIIHTNGVDGLLIEHNRLHDPSHPVDPSQGQVTNVEHHDCWQPQNTSNAKFLRNMCYWTSGLGAWSKYTSAYLGQCVMVSGNGGPVSNVVVANNLFYKYNGRPINMNGVSGLQYVNNTDLWCGDGISVTVGSSSSDVRIGNNIVDCIYLEGSTPTYCANNWIRAGSGYGGNFKGSSYWQGDPGLDAAYKPLSTSPVRGKGDTSLAPANDLGGEPRTTAVLGCYV